MDYIPSSDSGFDAWLTNFSALLTAAPTTYGLIAGDAVIVAAQQVAYNAAFVTATTPATRTSPTIAAKDAARATALATVRPYAVNISLNAGVADLDKIAIGVTVAKLVPTPVPPPLTVPVLSLVSATHLVQQLAYRDTATPTSKAKPPGVTGMEIWRSIGTTASVDPSQADFNGIVTKSPLVQQFQAGDVGKVVTYWARWVTRGGPGGQAQTGPWSTSLVTGAI